MIIDYEYRYSPISLSMARSKQHFIITDRFTAIRLYFCFAVADDMCINFTQNRNYRKFGAAVRRSSLSGTIK